MVKPSGLDGKGSRVIVSFAVGEKNGLVYFVGMHERRNFEIGFRAFPESPSFALESEGCKGPVVGAAPGNPGRKKVAVCQQVGGHKSAVAVPTNTNALGVNDAHGIQLVYGCFGARYDLVDKSIVHGFRVPDHGHLSPVEKGVSLGHKEKL